MSASKVKSSSGYNRARLIAIILVMAANSSCTVVSLVNHHYPLGAAPILLLIPGLLRELDMRRGEPARRLGSFEWSCFIAGFLFLGALPFFIT